jgi:hypothetical protein
LFLLNEFEADNDYITKIPFAFIKSLDNVNGQWRKLPRVFLTGLKKKIEEHVTASVSLVGLHSKIQPGVPLIEIKEIYNKEHLTKKDGHRSKYRGMIITNSKAI